MNTMATKSVPPPHPPASQTQGKQHPPPILYPPGHALQNNTIAKDPNPNSLSKQPPLCVNCAHFNNGGLVPIILSPFVRKFAKCMHPEACKGDSLHFITGGASSSYHFYYCATMRLGGACGKTGRLWSPK